MRAHFHNGKPKGTFRCAPCTLAVYPVLCAECSAVFRRAPQLARDVREMIATRAGHSLSLPNAKLLSWSLGEDADRELTHRKNDFPAPELDSDHVRGIATSCTLNHAGRHLPDSPKARLSSKKS